jgi:hypothetical protein
MSVGKVKIRIDCNQFTKRREDKSYPIFSYSLPLETKLSEGLDVMENF